MTGGGIRQACQRCGGRGMAQTRQVERSLAPMTRMGSAQRPGRRRYWWWPASANGSMKPAFLLPLIAALGLGLVGSLSEPAGAVGAEPAKLSTRTLAYSELLNTIDANHVASARISGGPTRTRIEVVLHNGAKAAASYLPSDTIVQQHLVAHHVRVTVAGSPTPSWIFPGLPIAFVVAWLLVVVALLHRKRILRRPGRRGRPA